MRRPNIFDVSSITELQETERNKSEESLSIWYFSQHHAYSPFSSFQQSIATKHGANLSSVEKSQVHDISSRADRVAKSRRLGEAHLWRQLRGIAWIVNLYSSFRSCNLDICFLIPFLIELHLKKMHKIGMWCTLFQYLLLVGIRKAKDFVALDM